MDQIRQTKLLSLTFRRLVKANAIEALTLSITGIVDCAMVGQFIGSKGLPGMQLDMPLFFLFCVISQIFASGLTMLISRHLSHGHKDKAQRLLSSIITMTLLIGIVFVIIGLICPEWMLYVLAGPVKKSVKVQSVPYLIPILIGAPVILLYDIFVAVIILEGADNQLVKSVIAIIAVDIIADRITGELPGGSDGASGHPGIPQLKYELYVNFSGHNVGLLS